MSSSTHTPFVYPRGPFSGSGYSPQTGACVNKQQKITNLHKNAKMTLNKYSSNFIPPFQDRGKTDSHEQVETLEEVYQGFPVVCLSSNSCFSSSVNCRSSSKELLSRSWMYCSMLLLDLCGGVDSCGDRECDELDWATCMLLNWLRRSSYCDRREKGVTVFSLRFVAWFGRTP